MSAPDALAALLLLLLAPDWLATAAVWRLHRAARENTALASRAKVSALLSVAASLVAVLAAAALMRVRLPSELSTAIVAAVFLCVSAPQVHWLWLYLRGDWR